MTNELLREKTHEVDLCVVGGGMAGLCAAIAAARRGAKVALVQDRPVLGGNASSEIRMWIRGCQGKNNQETGILEEIFIENMYRNPDRNFSIWDSILYEKARFEPNISLFLNCSCNNVVMEGSKIKSIRAWQLTTYTWHTIEAKYFADCSGDSILAPLTGAEFRVGREASSEFGEDIAPATADRKTMGLTCLMQARETGKPVKFIPPEWAIKIETDDMLPFRGHNMNSWSQNFWWMELGGVKDSIHDTEELRDELLKLVFGVWDHIKNRGDHEAENWELEWVGFLPGKRESRRYVGDYILTQNDVRSEGKFEDLVAYGGWAMDDHHPEGFNYPGHPTIFHPAPEPFGIPYRSLYSCNIENLFFAGRNISATHTALSSTRVMATCAIIGQAVGTATAIAVKNGLSPRGVYEHKLNELKQALMDDDCYLPWNKRAMPKLTQNADISASEGNPEVLRNGYDKPIGTEDNGWYGSLNSWVQYSFNEPQKVSECRFIFDSDLERSSCKGHEILRTIPMICNRFFEIESFGFPETMLKTFKLEYLDSDGNWQLLKKVKDNRQRLVKIPVDIVTHVLRFIPEETWGAEKAHVFAWDIK